MKYLFLFTFFLDGAMAVYFMFTKSFNDPSVIRNIAWAALMFAFYIDARIDDIEKRLK